MDGALRYDETSLGVNKPSPEFFLSTARVVQRALCSSCYTHVQRFTS